ncbi:18142_t:CDS:2 [Racocetra fulgida]|uniref:18142_t:CDS:1 n=1 Tax=Racocetra fulgida TaxID=60492 RepID=A0A9N8Z1G8_9GLOM|nr:18142_t:CDS:2 [Racocetra fulgida]
MIKKIHTNKSHKKIKNQVLVHNLELPIVLIEYIRPYLSTQEVIESLDYLDNDNHQVQLSNSNFIEDFSILPSVCPSSQSTEVFDLREVLSDIE